MVFANCTVAIGEILTSKFSIKMCVLKTWFTKNLYFNPHAVFSITPGIFPTHFGAENSWIYCAQHPPRWANWLFGALQTSKTTTPESIRVYKWAPSRDIREAPAAFFCSTRREFSAPDGAIIKNFLVSVAPNRLDYAHTHAAKGRSIISVFMLRRRLTPCKRRMRCH